MQNWTDGFRRQNLRWRLGVRDLTDYRVFLLGHDGHIATAKEFDSADDQAATEWAKQFVGEHAGELWQLDRLVAHFTARGNK